MAHLPIFVPIFAFLGLALISAAIYEILKYREQGNSKLTIYLIASLVSVGFWIIFTFLQLEIFSAENNLKMYVISTSLSNIGILIGLILIAIVVEYFVQPKLRTIQLGVEIFLLALAVGFYITHIIAGFTGDENIVNVTLNLANIINPIMLILVLYSAINDINTLLSENLSEKQTSQVTFFRNSLLVGLGGGIPVVVVAAIVDQSFLGYSYIIISASLFFMVRAYAIDPRIAFILPEKTNLAIIVNNHGTLRYSKIFYEEEEDQIDNSAILISGALKAVTTMMSDFYQTEVQPSLIQFKDEMILFKWTAYYFLAVFTEQDSPLIRAAMERTVTEVNNKYEDNMEKVMFEDARVLDADGIFDETFFFIYK